LTKILLNFFQSENLNNLKNKEFFSLLFKIELKNGFMVCVDMNRIISNEFYLMNTYDENLELLFKYYSNKQ
jgi:hypothetical protein